MIASPNSSSISSKKFQSALIVHWLGWMYVLMMTTLAFLWSGFSIRIPSNSVEVVHHLVRYIVDTLLFSLLWKMIAIPLSAWLCMMVWSGISRGFSGRVLVSWRHRMSKSHANLSMISIRFPALAQFQEPILKYFFDRRSAFVIERFFPLRFLLLPPLLRLIWYFGDLVLSPGPCARSPIHRRGWGSVGDGDVVGCVWVSMQGLQRLREITGHSGRALLPEKELRCRRHHQPDTALYTRLPAFATIYPNSHTAHRHVGPPEAWGLLSRLSPLDPLWASHE